MTTTPLPEPVTPDYFEHEDDDDCWRECPDDCDIIDSAGGGDLIVGNEYECEVAWRGTQRFRVTKIPDDASDDYEVKLVSSSHSFYTADQLQAYAAVTAAKDAEIERLRDVVDAIYIYANDTLSGRTDGPDDRDWQRAAVVEIRNRARTFATMESAVAARANFKESKS